MKPSSSHPFEEELKQLADPGVAESSKRFHKKEKVHPGGVTQFLGVRMPVLRAQAGRHTSCPLDEIPVLLRSRFHETRLLALLILVAKFKRADEHQRTRIYTLYLNHTRFLNSWDLVDCSAYFIVGPTLENRSRAPLYTLATSESLWERRIAMLSTLRYALEKFPEKERQAYLKSMI